MTTLLLHTMVMGLAAGFAPAGAPSTAVSATGTVLPWPVPAVGDAAYFVDPTLIVLKQGRVLNIMAADRAQAVAVAGKVLPRFE